MEDDMANIGEIAVKLAEENTTRKILAVAKESGSKDEIISKIEAMLEK
jgi:hypothetical protein